MAFGFVIRSAFWLSVVAANLPAPEGAPGEGLGGQIAGGLQGAASSLVERSADAARGACLSDPVRCAGLAAGASALAAPSRDTLQPGDRAPGWRPPPERPAAARPQQGRMETPRS